jgi:phosphatidylserine/phosphatidylglycerophosphate/cardiolipin synthase-like enzyme
MQIITLQRKLAPVLYLFGLMFLFPCSGLWAADLILPEGTPVQVYFSPDGGSTTAVLKSVREARKEILIQAYSFRTPVIAQALIEASRRGVKIEMIIDKSERQEGLTPPTIMANAGIPVYLDGKHAVANNRVMIIDRETVLTGSFNFNTASEEMNAENLVMIKSKALAEIYYRNWLRHKEHAEPF